MISRKFGTEPKFIAKKEVNLELYKTIFLSLMGIILLLTLAMYSCTSSIEAHQEDCLRINVLQKLHNETIAASSVRYTHILYPNWESSVGISEASLKTLEHCIGKKPTPEQWVEINSWIKEK